MYLLLRASPGISLGGQIQFEGPENLYFFWAQMAICGAQSSLEF